MNIQHRKRLAPVASRIPKELLSSMDEIARGRPQEDRERGNLKDYAKDLGEPAG